VQRRHRLRIAAIVIWCLAFAQAATAAHACSALKAAPTSPEQAMESTAQPMQPGCAGMASQTGSTVKLCSSHCFASPQVHGQVDIPSANIAPPAALVIRVVEERIPAHSTTFALAPLATAPPPQLRFNRFLI
jgi:hypothetical protein